MEKTQEWIFIIYFYFIFYVKITLKQSKQLVKNEQFQT